MAPEQIREEDRDGDPDDPLTGEPGEPDEGGVAAEFVDAPIENAPGDSDSDGDSDRDEDN